MHLPRLHRFLQQLQPKPSDSHVQQSWRQLFLHRHTFIYSHGHEGMLQKALLVPGSPAQRQSRTRCSAEPQQTAQPSRHAFLQAPRSQCRLSSSFPHNTFQGRSLAALTTAERRAGCAQGQGTPQLRGSLPQSSRAAPRSCPPLNSLLINLIKRHGAGWCPRRTPRAPRASPAARSRRGGGTLEFENILFE